MKTLLLIDANSLIRRFFHALPPLTATGGKPAQAVYGLGGLLLKMCSSGNLEYAAAAYDRPEPTFRKLQYAEYKAHRPPTPEGLVPQLLETKELFRQFGIKTFEQVGFEADDLIATLVAKFVDEPDLRIEVLTGDTDLFQLVRGETVLVRTFLKGVSETALYNERAVHERYGLSPEQILDYKSLVGDASDNIKGVAGIGPKTASALIGKYGSLDNLYKNLEQEPKVAEKLSAAKDQVALARSLLKLRKDTEIELNGLDDLAVASFDKEAVTNYFQSMGFTSLVKRLKGESVGVSVVPKNQSEKQTKPKPQSLF